MNDDHTTPNYPGEFNPGDFDPGDFNPGALAAAEAELDETRRRIADAPANVVVNHVMGLYELAAIHLSANPPRLDEAVLAIDAVACLVEGLGERLGEEYPTMRDALSNIQMGSCRLREARLDLRCLANVQSRNHYKTHGGVDRNTAAAITNFNTMKYVPFTAGVDVAETPLGIK